MKKIYLLLILPAFLLLSSAVFADYSAFLTIGMESYKKGDFSEALGYYKQAYAEKPNDQLKTFIKKLEKQVQLAQQEQKDYVFKKTMLFGADLILAGLTTYSYMDYNQSAAKYEDLFLTLNDTDTTNFKILEYEKSQVEQKGMFMAVLGITTGVAILYTLADMFFLHNAFEPPADLSFIPEKQYVGLTKEWRF